MTAKEETRFPPDWLNDEYLTTALRQGLQEPALTVSSSQIKPATAVGDNYASLMFRAQLQIVRRPNLQPEPLSIVCKTLPSGDFKTMVQDQEIFEKEAFRLSVTMPAINKILQDISPDEQPLCADFIYFGTEPEQVIILQDLKELGFNNLDRMGGLDLQTSKLVLRNLARLHAASLYLLETDPDKLRGAEECMWIAENKNNDMKKMLTTSLDQLIAEVSEWKDFPAEYVQKLKNLQDGVMDLKLREALALKDQSLNVFQHGDCWINNIMFSKKDEDLTGLRFVDFQICCLNSAAMDLNYFLFTSPKKDIRIAKIDEMLRFYYDNFIDLVSKLNLELHQKFTFDDLKHEVKTRGFFGLVATIIVYPITITETKDVMDVNDFFDEDGSKKRGQFQSKMFKEVLKLVFPYFVDCGVV